METRKQTDGGGCVVYEHVMNGYVENGVERP
jgi:hypothetical protein